METKKEDSVLASKKEVPQSGATFCETQCSWISCQKISKDFRITLPKDNVGDYILWELVETNHREKMFKIFRDQTEVTKLVFDTPGELDGSFRFSAKDSFGNPPSWELISFPKYLKKPWFAKTHFGGVEISNSLLSGNIVLEKSVNGTDWKVVPNKISRRPTTIAWEELTQKILVRFRAKTKSTNKTIAISNTSEISFTSCWPFIFPIYRAQDYFIYEKLVFLPKPFESVENKNGYRHFIQLSGIDIASTNTFPFNRGLAFHQLKHGIKNNQDKIIFEETKKIFPPPQVPSSYFSAELWPFNTEQKIGRFLILFPNGKYLFEINEFGSYGFIQVIGIPSTEEFSVRLHPRRFRRRRMDELSPSPRLGLEELLEPFAPMSGGDYRAYDALENVQDQFEASGPFGIPDLVKIILNYVSASDRDGIRFVCKQWFNYLVEDPREFLDVNRKNGVTTISKMGKVIFNSSDSKYKNLLVGQLLKPRPHKKYFSSADWQFTPPKK